MAAAEYSGWTIARKSYALLFRAPRDAFRAAGIWIVALSLYPVVLKLLTGGVASLAWAWIYFLIPTIVTLFAYAATAVAWHRFVLQRRPPSFLPPLGRVTFVYLITLFLYFLLVWLAPFMLIGMMLPVSNDSPAMFLIPLAIAFVLFGLTLRFALKFPAVAIGDTKMGVDDAWRLSGPIWAGLVLGAIITFLPAFLLGQIANAIWYELSGGGNVIGSFLFTTVDWTITFASIMLLVTFLSLSYRHVVGDKDVAEVFA